MRQLNSGGNYFIFLVFSVFVFTMAMDQWRIFRVEMFQKNQSHQCPFPIMLEIYFGGLTPAIATYFVTMPTSRKPVFS